MLSVRRAAERVFRNPPEVTSSPAMINPETLEQTFPITCTNEPFAILERRALCALTRNTHAAITMDFKRIWFGDYVAEQWELTAVLVCNLQGADRQNHAQRFVLPGRYTIPGHDSDDHHKAILIVVEGILRAWHPGIQKGGLHLKPKR